MEKIATFLGWMVLLTLLLAIARQLSETKVLYRRSYEGYEDAPSGGAMEPKQGSSFSVNSVPSGIGSMNPALPGLQFPMLPYTLREDIPFKCERGNLSAESCFTSDFASSIQETGNFIQSTNNYVHKTPDSCTAPFTELVDSFYLNN